jgi:type III secretion YscU/HrpY family protein
MSGEKTEPPTQKRIRDARKKGQVAKSNDLVQSVLFLAAGGALALGGGTYVTVMRQIMVDFFRPDALRGDMPNSQLLTRMGYAWEHALLLLAPMLLALMFISALVTFLQVNVLFSFEVIKPKLEKLNPITGFKNIFLKPRTYLELAKNLVKFTIVLWLAYATVKSALRDLVMSARLDLLETGRLAASLMFQLLFKVGGAFLVIGAADFLIQKRLYLKDLRMSKYDVQREHKEEEGDPRVKRQRKQLHQQILQQGALLRVPRAHAVIVNPTHIAVAIRYEEATMQAPQVTAKGQDAMAQTIIAIARQNQIPVVRNVSLARGLYAVEVDAEIPEQLYEAVAEVLNWIFQLAQAEEMNV